MLRLLVSLVAVALCLHAEFAPAEAADSLQFGFARTDITPTEPLRLSGYGNRTEPAPDVDEPLYARCLVMRSGDNGSPFVLLSVDTIGFPGTLTKAIHERIDAAHHVTRDHFVICCTHSHTTPHVSGGLTNLFAVPLSDTQQAATDRYTQSMADKIVDAVGQAFADLQPGRMFHASGEASFAVNRRLLTDGVWSGFGVNREGPVDHSLPVVKITDPTGQHIRGLVFNYACHCTTFGGEYNRVNGDWAGYAAKYLEAAHPEATALCTIGCGADQNPDKDREKVLESAQAQGHEIADEVDRLIGGDMREITADPQASFGYAGLPIDRPTIDELQHNLGSERPQVRQHAENMLAIHQRMGRLPETYPMPIQVWRFGDSFAMVFLGGEVCVDYVHRIQRELGPLLSAGDAHALPVWVSAYANDVFGYVASERMRPEGGYEVDFSMVYYNQPGRWSTGTEDVILRRVHEMFDRTGQAGPFSAEDAVSRFTVPAGYHIDVIASEPLIRDPIHMALGADGRLWVVEMGDYPRGNPDVPRTDDEARHPWDGPPGGRIRVLSDTDKDGRFDEGVTFLDDLTFPTGVLPWRDGALVCGAPDVIFAKDTDDDGRADVREVLYSGFDEANPQHRVSGFTPDIDNWLYLSSGTTNFLITSSKTGTQVDISGRDSRIRPDEGLLEPVSGQSQYGRSRSDWGEWFGNQNSQPLFHFAIEDRYLQRNPYVPAPSPKVYLTQPAHAPPVYPTSRTLDRFNDLFALDRFTSACSPHILRDEHWIQEAIAAGAIEQALVSESVHNLVSRILLMRDGVTFRGERHPGEEHSEFLSSSDNWFRPVHLLGAPDGSLWICDMYREVIEHPEWIPEAWQAQLDLYAGHNRGRIYRLARDDQPLAALPDLTSWTTDELVARLASENGWQRDTAQRLLIERPDSTAVPLLQKMVATHPAPLARVHALGTLDGLGQLDDEPLRQALHDADPRVVRWAIRFCEPRLAEHPQLLDALLPLSAHTDQGVRFQLALALGDVDLAGIADALMEIALHDADDPWIRAAVLSSSRVHAADMTQALLSDRSHIASRTRLLQDLIATALGDNVTAGAEELIGSIAPHDSTVAAEDWQFVSLGSCLEALRRRKVRWDQLSEGTAHCDSTALPSGPHFGPGSGGRRVAPGDGRKPSGAGTGDGPRRCRLSLLAALAPGIE